MNFAEEERKQGKYVDPIDLSLTCNGCHFHGVFLCRCSSYRTIFHEKHVKAGSFLPHLDSTIQNQIYIDTIYNEHLRPSFFYLVHLIHIAVHLIQSFSDSNPPPVTSTCLCSTISTFHRVSVPPCLVYVPPCNCSIVSLFHRVYAPRFCIFTTSIFHRVYVPPYKCCTIYTFHTFN